MPKHDSQLTTQNQVQSTLTSSSANRELDAMKALTSRLLVVSKEELDDKLKAEKRG